MLREQEKAGHLGPLDLTLKVCLKNLRQNRNMEIIHGLIDLTGVLAISAVAVAPSALSNYFERRNQQDVSETVE